MVFDSICRMDKNLEVLTLNNYTMVFDGEDINKLIPNNTTDGTMTWQ